MLNNLTDHLDIIFFFYGLAYLTLGIIILFQTRVTQSSSYKLLDYLWLLGFFGFTHGAHEFVDMFILIKGKSLTFELIGALFSITSYLALFFFGYEVLNINKRRIGYWLPASLIVIVFSTPLLVEGPVMDTFKVSYRYFLGFTGSMLTAAGLSLYYVEAIALTDRFKFKKYFVFVTLFFVAYAVFGGLVPVEAGFFPASIINKEWFFKTFGLPVEFFRAICAVGIAWAMWHIVNIFNIEADAEKERLDAELLESKNLLEMRVEQRTAALFEANKLLKQEIKERRKAEQSLTESQARFRTVLDSLDAIVYVADMQTYEILFANKYLKDNFGDITGRICWQSLQQDQTGPCEFCTNHRLIDGNGQPLQAVSWEFENTANGRWYAIQDRAIEWTDSRIVRLEIAIDITDRKTAEEALRKSEWKYQNLINQANDAIFIADIDTGNLIEANKKAEELLGIPAERIVGMHQSQLHPPSEIEYYRETFKKHVETGQSVAKDLYVKHSDGHLIPVEVSSSVIELDDRKLIIGIFRDITDRKQIETIKDKVNLAKQIVRAVENERKSLSAEIHDDLLQVAFSALAYCKSVYNVSIESMSGKDRLDMAISCLDKLLQTGRKIIRELEPPMFDSIGLQAAIQEHAKNLFEGYEVSFTMQHKELPSLPNELEVAIFRITQEALVNVLKHASATNVSVSFDVNEENLMIQIEDDGIGVDGPVFLTGHLGMKLMKERAELYNGSIVVSRAEDKGTRIFVNIPIDGIREEEKAAIE